VRETKKPWRQQDLSKALSERLGPEKGEEVLGELESRRPVKEQRYLFQSRGGAGHSEAAGGPG